MKLPATVRIFGKTYKVNRAPTDHTNKQLIKVSSNIGASRASTQEIEVGSDIHDEQVIETFFHEIVHMIDADLCTELTERQVSCLGVGIAAVILENGWHVPWAPFLDISEPIEAARLEQLRTHPGPCYDECLCRAG